jgi:hypothetical protein
MAASGLFFSRVSTSQFTSFKSPFAKTRFSIILPTIRYVQRCEATKIFLFILIEMYTHKLQALQYTERRNKRLVYHIKGKTGIKY